jgi:CRP-like cAMP-binding protein
MPQVEQSAVGNRLLTALPPDAFGALALALQPVELRLRQSLHEPGQPIQAVHFPEGSVVSLLVPPEDGHAEEIGVIGREGLAGLPVVLGADRTATRAIVQMEGPALRVQAAELRAASKRSAPLRALLLRYAQAFHLLVRQTAACNGHHPAARRLARWLLMLHDRAEGDEFPVMDEFISLMLGPDWAGISVAVGILQRAGVIMYEHDRVTVLDRAGLEAACCECYSTVRQQYEHLLGGFAGK